MNIEVESMSRRSIRYRSEIWRGENRVASSTHTAVCVDRRQTPLQAVALPPEVTARLKAVGH